MGMSFIQCNVEKYNVLSCVAIYIIFYFKLAGELEADAVSHLEEVSDAGISAMVQSGTVGILLPTTAYILRLKSPPARKMIDQGLQNYMKYLLKIFNIFNRDGSCFG